MKKIINAWRLKSELRAASHDPAEARSLQKTASHIHRLSSRAPVSQRRSAIYEEVTGQTFNFWAGHRFRQALASVATLLLITGATTAYAQRALPGDSLYGVKRLSETVRLWFNPGYSKQVADRRRTELNRLKNTGQPSTKVHQAEQDLHQAEDRQQSGSNETDRSTDGSSNHDSSNDSSGSGQHHDGGDSGGGDQNSGDSGSGGDSDQTDGGDNSNDGSDGGDNNQTDNLNWQN